MAYDTHRDIENKLPYFHNVRGSSITGIDEGNTYKVLSYSTTIAIIDKHTKQMIYFNNKFFSVTTSMLQNMLIRVFANKDKYRERVEYHNGKKATN